MDTLSTPMVGGVNAPFGMDIPVLCAFPRSLAPHVGAWVTGLTLATAMFAYFYSSCSLGVSRPRHRLSFKNISYSTSTSPMKPNTGDL